MVWRGILAMGDRSGDMWRRGGLIGRFVKTYHHPSHNMRISGTASASALNFIAGGVDDDGIVHGSCDAGQLFFPLSITVPNSFGIIGLWVVCTYQRDRTAMASCRRCQCPAFSLESRVVRDRSLVRDRWGPFRVRLRGPGGRPLI
jgi:hypothetical protein